MMSSLKLLLTRVRSATRRLLMLIRSLLPDMISCPQFFSSSVPAPTPQNNDLSMYHQALGLPNHVVQSGGLIYLNTGTGGQNVGAGGGVVAGMPLPPIALINLADKDAQMHMFNAVWSTTPRHVIFRFLMDNMVRKCEHGLVFVRTHVLPYLPYARSLSSFDEVPKGAPAVCPSCKQASRPWFMNPPELVVIGTFVKSLVIVYLTVLREASNCALSML